MAHAEASGQQPSAGPARLDAVLTCPACGRGSPADAAFCAGCGAQLGATTTTHESRRTVTALFCDLVGSTTLGERNDPEVLRPLLERYFGEVRATVERHGGRVEKFIGDAVSAVFGLPISHEDDALRAVRAGLEVQERLARLNAGSAIPLAARVGVTTGEVLVPGGGAPLIGDAMNTASRIQSGASPGWVLVGEPTWRLVRDSVRAEPLPPLEARGKAEPVAVWRVLATVPGSAVPVRRTDTPMVGRRRELEALRNAFWRAASDRACELVTVLGVAGAGKSRLVEEFLGSLPGDAEVLRGRCLSYGEGITWLPVAEALRGALGLPEFAPVDEVRSALHGAVAGDERADALEAALTPLFAVGGAGSAPETAWAFRRLVESRAWSRMIVLVLDDVHWGDAAFLDLVEHLAGWTRDAPVLLVCMARLELLDARPAWGGGLANAVTLSLAPLAGAEADALLEGLLGGLPFPREVRELVARVAGGNPLFAEELVRELVDRGALVCDGDAWRARPDVVDAPVPPTVSALLSARLDRLGVAEREVVEAASVEGQSFHASAVAALLPPDARTGLDSSLRSLVRRDLVVPEPSAIRGEDAYRFRHLLIRDAAYDAIPKAERATLHVAFADWLEAVAGDRIGEQIEVVAHHLLQGHRYREALGLPDDPALRLRAAQALLSAGSRALDRMETRTCEALLESAAALARGSRLELEVLDRQLSAASDHSIALFCDRGRLLFRVAERWGDEVLHARARAAIWVGDRERRPETVDLAEGMRLLDATIEVLRGSDEPVMLCGPLTQRAWIDYDAGRIEAGLRLVEEAHAYAVAAASPRWQGVTRGIQLEWSARGTRPLPSVAALADDFVAAAASSPSSLYFLLHNRAGVNALAGRTASVARDTEALGAIARDLGVDGVGLEEPAGALALAAWAEGRPADGVALLEPYVWRLADSELGWAAAEYVQLLARMLLEAGHPEGARDALDRLPRDPGLRYRVAAMSLRNVCSAHDGRFGEALAGSEAAIALAASTEFLDLQGDASGDRAEILLLAGRADDARPWARDALDRHTRKGHAIGARRAQALVERSV